MEPSVPARVASATRRGLVRLNDIPRISTHDCALRRAPVLEAVVADGGALFHPGLENDVTHFE